MGAVPSPLEWPGTCFPTEKHLKGSLSFSPSLPLSRCSAPLRLSCGYFSSAQCILGKYSGIQEEEMFTIPPPQKREKSKVSNSTCFSLSVSVFKSNFPSVDSWFSFIHRSPRHVRHPPTMNWWVRASLCVCVSVWKATAGPQTPW